MFKLDVTSLKKINGFYHIKGSKHKFIMPKLNYDLALFIGLLYGDGWLVSRPKNLSEGRWGIGFVEGDVKTVKEFRKLAKKLFNVEFKFYPRIRKFFYYEARVNSRILYEFLYQNFNLSDGPKAKTIIFPKILKENHLLEPFIAGLISTDGSVRKYRISYSSASKDIIDEVSDFFIKKNLQ